MKSIEDLSYSDLKALCDFYAIRLKIVKGDREQYDEFEVDGILNKQKAVWLELWNRSKEYKELKP
tara:strand:- start:889 stop:1083 length:195 start_codon:yes stop_codon:yes gene_type:complete